MKNFKLFLKSLISNHACVEGGRKKPWYAAVIIFIVAMALALIPIFVQTITKQGDSIVSTNRYEMDVASYRFVETINEKGIDMKVQDHKLIVNEEKWNDTFTDKDASGNNCYIHCHNDSPDLGVYYIPSVRLTDDKYSSIVNFPSVNENGEAITVSRTYSYILFTEENVYIYIYARAKSSNQSIGTIYGDYKYLDDGYSINAMYTESVNATWDNWTEFYRLAYNNTRLELTWKTTLIMFGVNAGISIFMGFMLWVLTRGKTNLNWFGIWETQKIVYWTTLTPAILTTGLGFLISSFSQVMFPLLLGVRIMWLSMKLLRPENKDLYPPLKSKEKVVDVKPVK